MISSIKQDNHKLNETCLNRQASNYCTFDNLSKSLPYLEIPLLIQQQKCNQQNKQFESDKAISVFLFSS
jgi:hypothetical protein